MQVKNDYIRLKFGKREVEFTNLILDTYLRHMGEIQSSFDNMYWQSPFLSKCCVKFDRKLDFDETSILEVSDFDTEFTMDKEYHNTSSNKIEIEYVYKPTEDLSTYYNRRITAIGFFDYYGDTCFACVDLSNYSLTIKSDEDLIISRKDTLSTSATFISNNSAVKFPIHLSPFVCEMYIANPKVTEEYPYYTNRVSAYLYSVGLGTNKNIMKKEIKLTDDNTIYFGEKIIFKDIFSNENLVDILEPSFKYPQSKLYPTSTNDNFTFIFLKYKIYYNRYTQEGSVNYEHVDTDYWYTLSVPVIATGDFNYAITYERSDDNGI